MDSIENMTLDQLKQLRNKVDIEISKKDRKFRIERETVRTFSIYTNIKLTYYDCLEIFCHNINYGSDLINFDEENGVYTYQFDYDEDAEIFEKARENINNTYLSSFSYC